MKSFLSQCHQWLRGTPNRASASEAVAAVLLGVLLIGTGLTGVFGGMPWDAPEVPTWWHAVPLMLAGVVMLFKRSHPIGALVAVLPLLAVDAALGGNFGMMLVLIDLIYSATLRSEQRSLRRLLPAIAIAIGVGTAVPFTVTGDLQYTALMFIQFFAILATPVWWGLSVRQQRTLAELASARAKDLQRLAELRKSEAVREERARMARDLHDALSANLSAIAIHSEAALQPTPVETGSDRSRRALTDIRSASLAALKQLRSMVLLLRETEGETSAPARITDLEQLVQQTAATGQQVGLEMDLEALSDLVPPVEQATYRIVQESLTNATKHCPGGHTEVTVNRSDDTLQVQVLSTPAPAGTSHRSAPVADHGSSTPSPGVGLTHMRERAELLGGTLLAGWDGQPGARWRVRAELPITEEIPQ